MIKISELFKERDGEFYVERRDDPSAHRLQYVVRWGLRRLDPGRIMATANDPEAAEAIMDALNQQRG